MENCLDGLEKDYEIQPQRPVVNICQVKFHPFFEFNTISVRFDLPET